LIEQQYLESKEVGELLTLSTGDVIERSSVVHCLDRDISGVLLLSRTQMAYELLKKQFKKSHVRKTYS